jgi:hypothetical protein
MVAKARYPGAFCFGRGNPCPATRTREEALGRKHSFIVASSRVSDLVL